MANRKGRTLRWDLIPAELHYLRDAVERYGERGSGTELDGKTGEHVFFADVATDEEIAELAPICVELNRRGDNDRLIDWIEAHREGRPSERWTAHALRGLLLIFEQWGDSRIEPFATARVRAERAEPP
jgi:hypothetical protein